MIIRVLFRTRRAAGQGLRPNITPVENSVYINNPSPGQFTHLFEEVVLDQRENRLAPIELSILTVGYCLDGQMIQGLPPQPPLNLDSFVVCDEVELRAFTTHLTHLRFVLKAIQVPADELVVVHLRQAAAAHPLEVRHRFLVEAGRELVRLMNYDLVRLEAVLKRITPK